MSHIFLSRLPEPGKYGFADKDDDGIPYDLLGRVEAGKNLSALIERISDPLVIALNGDWGSGKSHFLRLWAGAHGKENGGTAQVIYFDAFENDFLDDPLTSLVAAIKEPPKRQKRLTRAYNGLKAAGAKLATPIARIAIGVATSGASEVIGLATDGLAKAAVSAGGDEAQKLIDAYWAADKSRRAAMDEFRAALKALTTDTDGTPRKLVFIVDELDRCRPDYALSLLETIKHFFAIKNVHFILGTNLTALESAVRVRYGADCDAGRYLQKFVHLTMMLPDGVYAAPGNGAADHYFDALIARNSTLNELAQQIRPHIQQLSKAQKVALRDVERILLQVALCPRVGDLNYSTQRSLLAAIIVRVLSHGLYAEWRSGRAQTNDVLGVYGLSHESIANDDFFGISLGLDVADALGEVHRANDFDARLAPSRGGGIYDRTTPARFERACREHLDTFQFTDQP